MAPPSIAELLKYADLQMAAEAFLVNENGNVKTGTEFNKALTDGNFHASKFTATQATEFAVHWEVLDQKPNTSTGFSGTLFRNKDTNELVMSFRSTEFIDDAARDNQATNSFELKDTGFAWGQLTDMEGWYAELQSSGKLPAGASFSVTGYSLGGHLATAFNLLHPDAAQQVVTFNGAGVGKVKFAADSLEGLLQEFKSLRDNPGLIDARFTDPQLREIYQDIRYLLAPLAWNLASVTEKYDLLDQAESLLNGYTLPGNPDNGNSQYPSLVQEKGFISDALKEIRTLVVEAERVGTLMAGGGVDPTTRPVRVSDEAIEAESLDYRMAVKLLAQKSLSASLLSGAQQAFGSKVYLDGYKTSPKANQFDVVGDSSPSMVSNSQWHIGQDVRIFIEKQPLYRGAIVDRVVRTSLDYGNISLLVDGYFNADFGDTHSLVLLVDSLNVQNALMPLIEPSGRDAAVGTLNRILEAASNLREQNGDLTIGNGQGKADGNTLESVLNALGSMLIKPKDFVGLRLEGSPNGNTWADVAGPSGYTGRDKFYATLKKIQDSAAYTALTGNVKLMAAPVSGQSAREDFGALLSLVYLSPFTLKFTGDVPLALQSAQQDLYTDWVHDKNLTPPQRLQGQAYIRDEYLSARAEFLTRVNYYNTQNARYDTSTGGVLPEDADAKKYDQESPDTIWSDLGGKIKIQRGGVTNITRYVVFGGEDAEPDIEGGSRDDRLFGGGGSDTLSGKGGNDYLQGDAGDDTLTGGEGDDTLVGGKGNDIYQFTGGFGSDTIVDSDGLGSIQIDGNTLQGGKKVVGLDGVWQNKEQGYTFVLSGSGDARSLLITKNGSLDAIRIQGWQDGQLGLTMDDTPAPPLAVEHTYKGDQHAQLIGDSYDWGSTQWATDGTLIGGLAEANSQDVIHGTYANDRISGFGGKDVLQGWLGDDEIDGGAGDDLIAGGPGRDILHGGAGNDTILGAGIFYYADYNQYSYSSVHAWNPVFDVSVDPVVQFDPVGTNEWVNGVQTWIDLTAPDPDVIDAGAGNDLVFGSAYDDAIAGDEGDDVLWGMEGNDIMAGGAGNDILIGDVDGVDYVHNHANGGDVPPVIYGKDFLDGGDGNDVLLGGGGGDILYGGAGNDVLAGDGSSALFIHGDYVNQLVAQDQQGDDFLDGGDGDDTLIGAGGNDVLIGGAGNDMLDGGSGNDSFLAGAGDTVTDSDGIDALVLADGEPASVTVEGVDVLLGYGNQGTLRIVDGLLGSIESIDGILVGDWLKSRLTNAVQVASTGANQSLSGGMGNDTLTALHEGVRLSGGNGNDTYVLGSSSAMVVELAGEGVDTVQSTVSHTLAENVENLTLTGTAAINGTGNTSDNFLTGNAAANVLIGGGGNDTLNGGDGNDMLYGEGGNDTLYASRGNDTLAGGDGLDTYLLNYSADRSNVVDDSAEGSIIKLGAAGMKFEDLNAVRRANDLVVEVRGTSASMRIKDYYTSTQTSWVFEDAQGNTTTGEALVAASQTDWASLQANLLKDFQSSVMGLISRGYSDGGYTQRVDGSWYRADSYAVEILKTYDKRTEYFKNLAGVTTSYVSVEEWNGDLPSQPARDTTAAITFQANAIASGTETLQSYNYAFNFENAWSSVNWTKDSSTHFETEWSPEYGTNGSGSVGLTGYTRADIDTDYYTGTANQLSFQDPGAPALAGNLPASIAVDFWHRQDSYNLGPSLLADGDQAVSADGYSAVIGGVGNNTIYGAGFAYGGTGNAQLIGGGTLMAGTGDQLLQFGQTMVVGDGHDTVVGYDSSRILVNPDNLGIDLIGQSFDWQSDVDDFGQSQEIKAIYQAMGYEDWRKNYEYGGKYRLDFGEDFVGYFDSLEDARAAFVPSSAWPTFDIAMVYAFTTWQYVEPLATLYKTPYTSVEDPASGLVASSYYAAHGITATVLTASDFAALQPLLQAELLPQGIVSFGPGLSLTDLTLSWGEAVSSLDGATHVTLDILWGTDQGIRLLMPRSGDALNSVVQQFEFSDGTVSSLLDLIALAPPAPDFDVSYSRIYAGMGEQSADAADVAGIRAVVASAADLKVESDGVDLLISIIGSAGDSLRIVGWYADSEAMPQPVLFTSGGAVISAAELTGKGLLKDGSAGGMDLYGVPDFATTFIAGPNTRMTGNSGMDIYVYHPGSGEVHITDPGGGTVHFGSGVSTTATLGLGEDSLVIKLGGQGDVIYLENFDRGDAENFESVTDFEFADGSTLSLQDLLDQGFDLAGTSDADSIIGTSVTDRILGGAGDDILQGGRGDDTLDGGVGADTMVGGQGDDIYIVDNAADACIELAGEGTDTLLTGLDGYTLGAGIENLILAGTAAIGGTGNSLDNTITGNSGNNVLMGGFGADTLLGGDGDDVLDGMAPAVGASVTLYVTDAATVQYVVDDGLTTAYTLTGGIVPSVMAGQQLRVQGGVNPVEVYVTPGSRMDGSELVAGGDSIHLSGNLADYSQAIDQDTGVYTFTRIAGLPEGQSEAALVTVSNTDTHLYFADGYLVLNAITDARLTDIDTYVFHAIQQSWLTGGPQTWPTSLPLLGQGADLLVGGLGNDDYFVDDAGDVVLENVGEGTDTVRASISYTLAANVENLNLLGYLDASGTGNAQDNMLTGNAGNNMLFGGDGFDVLEGGAGNDSLSDMAGSSNYFNGGSGDDELLSSAGGNLLIGGIGNDSITSDSGPDVIAFNMGDGQDTLFVNGTTQSLDDTISLGGAGLDYASLSLQKNGNDLVLKVSQSDQLTFSGWYDGTTKQNVLTLQLVAEAMAAFDAAAADPLLNKKVQTFDFQGLVGAFDAARTADPGLSSWALSNGLTQFHLAGSDSEALGGDLAYHYGADGTLAGIGLGKAQDVLTNAQFGAQAQTIHSTASLQEGLIRLG